MLWVYINNQGVAECKVNVGNRIRQGNSFYVFVCVEGQQDDPQTMVWSLQDIGYLKPYADEFVYLYDNEDIVQTEEEFNLNNPSQANSYFIGGRTYKGYKLLIPAVATTFPSNGGHLALSFLMMDIEGHGTYADTVSVYVEATQGMHQTSIGADDYATLINLFRASNVFNIGAKDNLLFLNDYYGASQSIYFTVDGVPYICLISFDEETGETTQTLISISEEGLMTAQVRKFDGEHWSVWSEQYFLDEITSIEETAVSGREHTYTIYTKSHPDGAGTFVVTDGITPHINPENKHWMFGDVDSGIVAEGEDGLTPYIDPTTKHWMIGSTDTGVRAEGLDAGIASDVQTAVNITTLEPGQQAFAQVSATASGPDDAKVFGFSFNLGIPKGADGVLTQSSGVIGFQINSDGNLIMVPSGLAVPNVRVVDDASDPNNGCLVYTFSI